jgi:hypothetical protein
LSVEMHFARVLQGKGSSGRILIKGVSKAPHAFGGYLKRQSKDLDNCRYDGMCYRQ